VQAAQQWQIVTLDIVSGQVSGARQMIERGGDLIRSVFVNSVAIESGDHDAMNCGRVF
jgi:hypothetical protein